MLIVGGFTCAVALFVVGLGGSWQLDSAALLPTAHARTVPDLHAAIRHALGRVTPAECRNCITAAGYEDNLAVAT